MNSVSLCSLAGRYDNPIPTRFLAPIDCLKIPAQTNFLTCVNSDLLIKFLVPLSAADYGGAGGVGAGLHLLPLIDGGNVSLQNK
jgi:hypothetical protein